VGADQFVPKFKPDELATSIMARVRSFVEEKGY